MFSTLLTVFQVLGGECCMYYTYQSWLIFLVYCIVHVVQIIFNSGPESVYKLRKTAGFDSENVINQGHELKIFVRVVALLDASGIRKTTQPGSTCATCLPPLASSQCDLQFLRFGPLPTPSPLYASQCQLAL